MKIVIGEGSCGLAAGAGKVHAKLDELFAASLSPPEVGGVSAAEGEDRAPLD